MYAQKNKPKQKQKPQKKNKNQKNNYLYISILFIHEFIKFYQYYPVFRKYYIETQQYTAFIKV